MSGGWQLEDSAYDMLGADSMLYVSEVLHRVANEYTNAISFVHKVAASSDSEEAKTAVLRIAHHLHALADTRRVLSPPATDRPTDFADSLSHLCQAMTTSWLAPRKITLQRLASRPIIVRERTCWRACLIISEFITNASRHAAFSNGGRIVVSSEVVSGRIVCQVTDDGSLPKTHVPGMGTRLISALAGQLEGFVERRFGSSGTTAVLSFPTDPSITSGELSNGSPLSEHHMQ
jgi:two-component system, sensor histidine kinase PdtaS